MEIGQIVLFMFLRYHCLETCSRICYQWASFCLHL